MPSSTSQPIALSEIAREGHWLTNSLKQQVVACAADDASLQQQYLRRLQLLDAHFSRAWLAYLLAQGTLQANGFLYLLCCRDTLQEQGQFLLDIGAALEAVAGVAASAPLLSGIKLGRGSYQALLYLQLADYCLQRDVAFEVLQQETVATTAGKEGNAFHFCLLAGNERVHVHCLPLLSLFSNEAIARYYDGLQQLMEEQLVGQALTLDFEFFPAEMTLLRTPSLGADALAALTASSRKTLIYHLQKARTKLTDNGSFSRLSLTDIGAGMISQGGAAVRVKRPQFRADATAYRLIQRALNAVPHADVAVDWVRGQLSPAMQSAESDTTLVLLISPYLPGLNELAEQVAQTLNEARTDIAGIVAFKARSLNETREPVLLQNPGAKVSFFDLDLDALSEQWDIMIA